VFLFIIRLVSDFSLAMILSKIGWGRNSLLMLDASFLCRKSKHFTLVVAKYLSLISCHKQSRDSFFTLRLQLDILRDYGPDIFESCLHKKIKSILTGHADMV
jgi:hypothetical protein